MLNAALAPACPGGSRNIARLTPNKEGHRSDQPKSSHLSLPAGLMFDNLPLPELSQELSGWDWLPAHVLFRPALEELGIHNPERLALLATADIDSHGSTVQSPVFTVRAKRLLREIEQALTATRFLSTKSAFASRCSMQDGRLSYQWEAQDARFGVIATVTFTTSSCHDEHSALACAWTGSPCATFSWLTSGSPDFDFLERVRGILEEILGSVAPRDRRVIELRFDLEGTSRRTLEALGQELDLTRERVRQIEASALSRLRHPSRSKPARPLYIFMKRLAGQLGCDLTSDEFARWLGSLLKLEASLPFGILELIADIFSYEHPAPRSSLAAFDEAVVRVLTRAHEALPIKYVAKEALTQPELAQALAHWPQLDPVLRIQSMFPSLASDDGMCGPGLPTVLFTENSSMPASMLRKQLRVGAVVRALKEARHPLHFEEIAERIRPWLDGNLAMNARNVHAWLGRYNGLFSWVGLGTYALRAWGLGHRQDLTANAAGGTQRRRGIGDEIAALLEERGETLPLHEVEKWIIDRFEVRPQSMLAAITCDRMRRFVLSADGRVGLKQRDVGSLVPAERATKASRVPPDLLALATQKANDYVERMRAAIKQGLNLVPAGKRTSYLLLAACLGMQHEFQQIVAFVAPGDLPGSLRSLLEREVTST